MNGRPKPAGGLELDFGLTIISALRVSSFHGPNMVKTILRLDAEHEIQSSVDEQRGGPTLADDLAEKISELVEGRHTGIFHVTNHGAVSWYEFARKVLIASGQDPDRVVPVSTADLQPPLPAPRPANLVLAGVSVELSGLMQLPRIDSPLVSLVSCLKNFQR